MLPDLSPMEYDIAQRDQQAMIAMLNAMTVHRFAEGAAVLLNWANSLDLPDDDPTTALRAMMTPEDDDA